MDPNEVLNNLRKAIDALEESWGDGPAEPETVSDAIDAFDALDSWMKMGGFLPRDWTRARND